MPKWFKALYSPPAFIGWLLLLWKPVDSMVNWASNVQFIVDGWPVVEKFLDSSLGFTATFIIGCSIIGYAIYRNVSGPQSSDIQNHAVTGEASNVEHLLEDVTIEWDGKGVVLFKATATRHAEKIPIFLHLWNLPAADDGRTLVINGPGSPHSPVKIHTIDTMEKGEVITITVATVEKSDGNQTIFKWNDWKTGVDWGNYYGYIIAIPEPDREERFSFVVVARSLYTSGSDTVMCNPTIISPSLTTKLSSN